MEIKTIQEQPKKFYQEQANFQLGQSLVNFSNKTAEKIFYDINQEVERQKQVEYNNKLMDLTTRGTIKIQDYKNRYSLNPNDTKARENLISSLNAESEKFLNSLPTNRKNEAKRQIDTLMNKVNNDLDVWAFEQNGKNGLASIEKQINTLNNNAVSYGMTGDIGTAMSQLELMGDNIRKNASLYMGEEKANQLTQGLVKDYYTSFFAGMLETQPEQVLANIEDQQIIKLLGTETVDKFRKSATTKLKNIEEYSIQKDIAGLMIKERDITNSALNGDLDFITLNNFIEENKNNLHQSTINYLMKKAGYSSGSSSNSGKEKIELRQKVEAEGEIERQLTLISIDPTLYSMENLKDLQNKVFDYANQGLIGESKVRDILNRINDYTTEINVYKSKNEYIGAKQQQEDKTAKILLNFVDDVAEKTGWYKTNQNGNFIKQENKNVLGNKKIIQNKTEINNLINTILSNYNQNKTDNLLEIAKSKNVIINDTLPLNVFYGSLSNSEKTRIQKLAKDKTIKDIVEGLGFDTTNKTPFENEKNFNNYITSKIQDNNNIIIEEEIEKILKKEKRDKTAKLLTKNYK